ncbi:MAG: hypothetical protein U9N04_04935 [Patescibacteria group bacterium]|nr:hypothetical protein [Patescibacteria group bacterium]
MKDGNLTIIKKNQKGQAALLIVLIVMGLLLFVSLVLTNMIAKRTKTTNDALQSVQAYYLADSGTEQLLYLCKALPEGHSDEVKPASGSSDLIPSGPGKQGIDFDGGGVDGYFKAVREQSAPLLVLKITGYYKNTARAVRLSY